MPNISILFQDRLHTTCASLHHNLIINNNYKDTKSTKGHGEEEERKLPTIGAGMSAVADISQAQAQAQVFNSCLLTLPPHAGLYYLQYTINPFNSSYTLNSTFTKPLFTYFMLSSSHHFIFNFPSAQALAP